MDAIGDAEPTADMGEVTGLLVRFKSCNNDTEKLAALQDSGLTLSQKTSIYTNLIASEEALKEQSDLEAYDGITAEKYYQYKTAVTGLTGKAAKLAAINALDLLREEKDALYFANGWAESKLNEAPWRSGRFKEFCTIMIHLCQSYSLSKVYSGCGECQIKWSNFFKS